MIDNVVEKRLKTPNFVSKFLGKIHVTTIVNDWQYLQTFRTILWIIVFVVNHVMSNFLGPLAFCCHWYVWSNCHGRVRGQTFFSVHETPSVQCFTMVTMFHNVSQCFTILWNIVKHCVTMSKNRRRRMCTGQLLGTDCPRNPQWGSSILLAGVSMSRPCATGVSDSRF